MPKTIQTFPTRVYMNPSEDLQIVGAELTQSDINFNLVVDVLNLSEIKATAIKFKVKFLDSFGKYLFDSAQFDYSEENIEILPHTVYYLSPISLDQVLNSARMIEISIDSASFEDGTIINYSQFEESLYTLAVFTQDKKEKIQSLFGKEVVSYGENFVDTWLCVCGALNAKETVECRNCKRNKNFVLNNLTEPLINLKLLNLIMAQSEDKNYVDVGLTSSNITKTPEHTEVIIEKRKNETAPIKKIREKSNLAIKILLSIVALFIALSMVLMLNKYFSSMTLQRQLENADKHFNAGQYEDALTLYEKLITKGLSTDLAGKIEDTRDLIESKNYYLLGEKLTEKGDNLNAIKNYKQVSKKDEKNYKNAQNKISKLEKSVIKQIREEYNNGIPDKAINILNKYLEIVPESADAQNLKTELTTPLAYNLVDKENSSSDTVDESETPTEAEDRATMAQKAKTLLHSYQKVLVNKANLRSGPSIESKVVTVVPTGSDVYVYETSIEGTERIWCKVEIMNTETGTIYDGWISSKVLN